MADELVLHFETLPNHYPDTAIAAQALLDWAELVKTAFAVVEPEQGIRLEIIGVHPGSTRFPQLLKFLDEQAGRVRSAWDDYPHLRSIVAGSAHTLWTATVAGGVSLAMLPDEQSVRLSEKDRELLQKIGETPEVQAASNQFYQRLERDSAISGVGVANDWEEYPPLIVPRSEFPERSGLWVNDSQDVQQRTHSDQWNVVLLRPALISTPQSWQFMRDGLKFSAKMHDAKFLAAIRDGRVPLTLQEGVVMNVRIEYDEILVGQIWEPVPNSRRVVKVLSPLPTQD
ncbi:hypothetical protein ACRAQ6_01495 [Erythrobacter sp. HA6-11]